MQDSNVQVWAAGGDTNLSVGGSLPIATTGSGNTTSGYYSLSNNTTGGSNTAYGLDSLSFNTTGSNNTAYGSFSLSNNTTGSNNTAYGSGAGPTTGNLTNTLALGYNAAVATSNTVQLGNTSITHIYGGPNALCQSTGIDCPISGGASGGVALFGSANTITGSKALGGSGTYVPTGNVNATLSTYATQTPVTLDVKNSSSQTLSTSGTVTIALPTVVTDTALGWNASTNQYTVPVTGTAVIPLVDG